MTRIKTVRRIRRIPKVRLSGTTRARLAPGVVKYQGDKLGEAFKH
jgi:hypothetical protein